MRSNLLHIRTVFFFAPLFIVSSAPAQSPAARARAALTSAKAHDADAVPVLIDLLAELNAEQCAPVEDYLTHLAGEWVPRMSLPSDDAIGRRIRRDAWASWWRHLDDAALLAVVRKHTLTSDNRRKVRQWIAKLGDKEFVVRATASKTLFAVGRLALPQLRAARTHTDAEVSRRAKLLIERIERQPAHPQLASAVRLLALRKPAGTVEALLAYLPYAEEDNLGEEVQTSLAALARRDDKAKSALRRVLDDSRLPPHVRMHVALALASAGEREAIDVLIDLLAVLRDESASRVEEALYQLAGDSAPKTPVRMETTERKKYRNAWAAWWKANAKRADLRRLHEPPMLGFTLICDTGHNRVYEIDRCGKERWAINNVCLPPDAVVLPGNRVLIAEFGANRVSERDFKGNILWQKQIAQPFGVQRLPNGNTFIATYQGEILEVNRAGKKINEISKNPESVMAAYRSRKGSIVCLTRKGECVLTDTSGKHLKSFDTNYVPNYLGSIDLSPNGRILVAQWSRNKVVEFDRAGKTLREIDAPGVATATVLPNRHILVASYQNHCVYELDRAGKVVWEHKNAGRAYRARRR